MFVALISLALSVPLRAAPLPPISVAGARPADSTQVPLTADAIHRMATFWTAFKKEAPAVRDDGRKANEEAFFLSDLSDALPFKLRVTAVDMVAMASKFPSVAADLKAAGLTVQQWEDYRQALCEATIADQADKASSAQAVSLLHKLPVWKNVEFIRTHKKEYDALVATGMRIPKLKPSDIKGLGGHYDM